MKLTTYTPNATERKGIMPEPPKVPLRERRPALHRFLVVMWELYSWAACGFILMTLMGAWIGTGTPWS